MILSDECKTKPDIDYPCDWEYKIIGTDKIKLKISIFDIMGEKKYTTRVGNSSSKGKFHSLNAKCQVSSEKERYLIFKTFQEHPDVKMVI